MSTEGLVLARQGYLKHSVLVVVREFLDGCPSRDTRAVNRYFCFRLGGGCAGARKSGIHADGKLSDVDLL